jgi:DNA-binding response OmpR family regulator
MSNYRQILIVEDDPKTVELIRLYVEREGYRALIARDGRSALQLVQQDEPALIVLDLMLPKLGGLEFCRLLREAASTVPIIMLTAKSTEEDVLRGLETGADDYITKPFSPRELLARIRTVLRRAGESNATRSVLRFGELVIDPLRHEVRWGDQLVSLTPKEFKLLETMGREPGRAFTRMELVQRVFGYDYEGLERTVDAHIMNLRRKIEPDSTQLRFIQTVYGVGYRFNGEIDSA